MGKFKFSIIFISLAGVCGATGGWFFGWKGLIVTVPLGAILGFFGAELDSR